MCNIQWLIQQLCKINCIITPNRPGAEGLLSPGITLPLCYFRDCFGISLLGVCCFLTYLVRKFFLSNNASQIDQ